MREIKFRAWDMITKKIYSVFLIDWISNNNKGVVYLSKPHEERIYRNLSQIRLMQFTGLKEKNGQEIYEGDIVKADFLNVDLMQVEWNNERGKFVLNCLKVNDGSDFSKVKSNEIEIIGNIFENPEMTK